MGPQASAAARAFCAASRHMGYFDDEDRKFAEKAKELKERVKEAGKKPLPPTHVTNTGMNTVADPPPDFAKKIYGDNSMLNGQSLAATSGPKAHMLDVDSTDYWVKELAREQNALNLTEQIKADNAKMYKHGAFAPGAEDPKKPDSMLIMFYEDGSILTDNILDRARTPNRDENNVQTNSTADNKFGRPTNEQLRESELFKAKQTGAPGLTPYEKLARQFPNIAFRKMSVNQWSYKIDEFLTENLSDPFTGEPLWHTVDGRRVRQTRTDYARQVSARRRRRLAQRPGGRNWWRVDPLQWRRGPA